MRRLNLGAEDTDVWRKEYYRGATNELYTTRITKELAGFQFHEFVRAAFALLGVTVIAAVHEAEDGSAFTVLLTPLHYTLKEGQYIAVIGVNATVVAKLDNVSNKEFNETLTQLYIYLSLIHI